MGILAPIAEAVGVQEAGAKLMISIFAGYPFAIIHRKYLFRAEKEIQYAFMAAVGFGFDAFHSLVAVLVAWFLCNYMAGTRESVIIAITGFMVHLLWGYWVTESAQYDITWTMPHCVLTLRLIGLVWDHYDGKQDEKELTPERKVTAIREPPTILEILAFSYFYASFLVGPQLPLVTFRRFVKGDFADPKTGGPPDTLKPMALRLGAGVGFLTVHLVMSTYYTNEMFFTEEWLNSSLFWKHANAIIWYQTRLLSYQSAWLITEGICILTGVAHNGLDEAGEVRWDGLRNFRIGIFYKGCSFQSIIESFNINTNRWSAKLVCSLAWYIFKRLKFLGNKDMSQFATLFFLAIWHGWHLGYFVTFFGEYLTVTAEKQLVSLVKRIGWLDDLLRTTLWPLTYVLCKLVMVVSSCFFFLPFGLIKKEKWIPVVYSAMYWDVLLMYMLILPIAFHVLRLIIPKPKPQPTKEE